MTAWMSEPFSVVCASVLTRVREMLPLCCTEITPAVAVLLGHTTTLLVAELA